jgi:hypothetical protein
VLNLTTEGLELTQAFEVAGVPEPSHEAPFPKQLDNGVDIGAPNEVMVASHREGSENEPETEILG